MRWLVVVLAACGGDEGEDAGPATAEDFEAAFAAQWIELCQATDPECFRGVTGFMGDPETGVSCEYEADLGLRLILVDGCAYDPLAGTACLDGTWECGPDGIEPDEFSCTSAAICGG